MLPHIDGEQRRHAMGNRRVGIMERGDLQLAVVEDQPSPSACKVTDAFLCECLKQRLLTAEVGIDHVPQLPGRARGAFRREALPEETMVPDLRAVVEKR